MTQNITRCPKCQTSFRVGEAHLNSAKGAVRCGSCLTIFNAREHLVHLKVEPEHPVTPEAREDEEDILISDNMEQRQDDDLIDEDDVPIYTSGDTGEYEFNLFERGKMDSDEDEEVNDDESWALDLLKSDDEEETSQARAKRGSDTSGSTRGKAITRETEAIEVRDDRADYGDHFAEASEHAGQRGENVYESERSDDDEDAYDEESAYREESISDNTYYTSRFQIIADEEEEAEPPRRSSSKPGRELFADENDEEGRHGNKRYLHAIEPEPVEFAWETHSPFWQSKLLWGSLSGIAALLLFAQLAWIQFDTLSTEQPYRRYYAQACEWLDCSLPVLIDRSKIKTANLVVRSHPKQAQALIVDAVLQNTARFEQSFPTLDLVFTDRQDKIVAARRLEPRDYLGGELAGREQMPIRQPIHIAIEIVDPGPEAIGYKISIAD